MRLSEWTLKHFGVYLRVAFSFDKERLGSNIEALASVFKPNSPKQAHYEALASCVLDDVTISLFNVLCNMVHSHR